jgi:hypothetical protein
MLSARQRREAWNVELVQGLTSILSTTFADGEGQLFTDAASSLNIPTTPAVNGNLVSRRQKCRRH